MRMAEPVSVDLEGVARLSGVRVQSSASQSATHLQQQEKSR